MICSSLAVQYRMPYLDRLRGGGIGTTIHRQEGNRGTRHAAFAATTRQEKGPPLVETASRLIVAL
jgi:hypothetical protein